ncbi:hypothetical protein ACFXTO_014460 [Malus domestica]
MDSEAFPSSRPMVKCCNCECSCSLVSVSSGGTWLRSVKRKYGEFEDGNRFFIPGLELYYNARVQMENECIALRETLSSQQKTIQDLYTELDEERNASSSAANEAMSMILRLQREKAEIQMEARQFKCFVEEKMAHEQQELLALEDLLYKREQAIQALTCEVQAYKHRMMSYGLTESEAEGDQGSFSRIQSVGDFEAQYELPTTPTYEYPPLKCKINETQGVLECDDDADIEKYAFGETPRGRDHLRNLESRLFQMEGVRAAVQWKGIFQVPRIFLKRWWLAILLGDQDILGDFQGDSPMHTVKETGPDLTESPRYNNSFRKADYVSQSEDYPNTRKFDNVSEVGDDMSDRVYTIDSVHIGAPYNGYTEAKSGVTPRGLSGPDFEDPDVMKLYMRLQALEADRESMRQAMLSMRTDKAQLVLLKEIAQHLCNDMSPEKRMIVKKPSIVGRFSSMSVFKWIKSFVFWRRRACRSKHMFGLSANVGLLMLLDKGPHVRQWRCLTSTQV